MDTFESDNIYLKKLYEEDYNLWLQKTAELLRKNSFNEIDLENLIKELEGLGRNNKRELENRVIVLIMHLLKYKYQPDKVSKTCRFTVIEQRRQINKLIKGNLSLQSYLENKLSTCYQDAREDVSLETRVDISNFPVDNPFTLEQILESNFFGS